MSHGGHAHERLVCPHGKLISQCRCPGARMDRVVTPCPFPEHNEPVGEQQAATEALAEMRLTYTTAIERWANDPAFHARCHRVSEIIRLGEGDQVEDGALVGARIGAAVAFTLVDTEAKAGVFDPVAAAETLNEMLRGLADVVKGGIATLVGEGWDAELARPMVMSMIVRSVIGGGQ